MHPANPHCDGDPMSAWAWGIGALILLTAGGVADAIHHHRQRDRDGDDHP